MVRQGEVVMSKFRRRAPPVSRSTPFKPGVSPTIQIKQQLIDAEKGREESYQRRRKELKERIDARVKQLEAYQNQLTPTKAEKATFVSRESVKGNVDNNAKKVAETKTYTDSSGRKVKVNENVKQVFNKSVRALPPQRLYDNPNQWIKIDFDGTGSDKYSKWKLEDIRTAMKLLIKQDKALGANKSDIDMTTKGMNVYMKPRQTTELWESVEVIYDEDSKEVWARLPKNDTQSRQIELSEAAVASASGVENEQGFGGF